MSRNQSEHLFRPFRKAQQQMKLCDAHGCEGEGIYRAPVSRDHLDQYYWFCLDHVRSYNRAWNFFAGLDEGTIERMTRADTVWQRPSWPFSGRSHRHYDNASFSKGNAANDPFGFFEQEDADPPSKPASTEETRALAVLKLRPPVTFEEIRQSYRRLVKEHHPDANGGDKAAEERLKIIIQAYGHLKAIYS